MNVGGEPEVLTEIPESLKRLVRYIIRGFYGMEHCLIMELLLHHPCIKEDDLIELLKFDRKQTRGFLNTLKTDKFIKTRLRMETDAEGKTTKHNYYFINFSVFVNVVKYKLDQMRRRIETEERDSTSRASFQCPTCQCKYTDLDAGQLLDPFTQQLLCTYCKTEVHMEANSTPQMDARMLMARFNEQMEPLFSLLREVEDIKLAPELLEPEPTDIKALRSHVSKSSSGDKSWRTSARNYGFGTQENQVTISMDSDGQASSNLPKPKEQPKWMKESTVEGAVPELPTQPSVPSFKPIVPVTAAAAASEPSLHNDEVMQVLLANEKKASAPVSTGVVHNPVASDHDSDTSESGDDTFKALPSVSNPVAEAGVAEMESEDEEEVEVTVTVSGRQVPYVEVTDEMVQHMTPAEKDEYIRVGQAMYQDMYD